MIVSTLTGLYRVDSRKTICFVKTIIKTLVVIFLEKLLSSTHYKKIRAFHPTVVHLGITLGATIVGLASNVEIQSKQHVFGK